MATDLVILRRGIDPDEVLSKADQELMESVQKELGEKLKNITNRIERGLFYGHS